MSRSGASRWPKPNGLSTRRTPLITTNQGARRGRPPCTEFPPPPTRPPAKIDRDEVLVMTVHQGGVYLLAGDSQWTRTSHSLPRQVVTPGASEGDTFVHYVVDSDGSHAENLKPNDPGQLIRQERQAPGWTQVDLAAKLTEIDDSKSGLSRSSHLSKSHRPATVDAPAASCGWGSDLLRPPLRTVSPWGRQNRSLTRLPPGRGGSRLRPWRWWTFPRLKAGKATTNPVPVPASA